jgi:hypothetical protein
MLSAINKSLSTYRMIYWDGTNSRDLLDILVAEDMAEIDLTLY